MGTIGTINIQPTWAGLLMALLAIYEDGDRTYARAELTRMAMFADVANDAADALYRIANMTDHDGNEIEMHREELRGIARAALIEFQRVPSPVKASTDNQEINEMKG